jgi:hypothetical protein
MRLRYALTLVSILGVLVGQTAVFAEGGSDNNNGNGHQIPLKNLAGTFAEAAQGSAVLCHDPDTGSPVGCDAPGAVAVPFAYVSVGPVIEDAEGDACGSFTATYSNLPPNANPPLVIKFQVSAKITSYDPTTGTGDGSFTSYTGATCIGASVSGGTVIGTGTDHSTASKDGDRLDFILTTISGGGAFSISGFNIRE